METFNSLEIGKRVWSFSGYVNHGPIDGAKINIPANTGGKITSVSRPYSTMDHFLYQISWDSGEISKHYFSELDPIGICSHIDEYEVLLKQGKNAKLVIGPQGGFKRFEMTIHFKDQDYEIRLSNSQKDNWSWTKELLEKNGVLYETEKLAMKKRS
jgi:hypothetical protein